MAQHCTSDALFLQLFHLFIPVYGCDLTLFTAVVFEETLEEFTVSKVYNGFQKPLHCVYRCTRVAVSIVMAPSCLQ